MMSVISQSVLSSFKRLCLSSQGSQRCLTTATSPLMFRMTQVVWAEPLKKKKKLDPMILRRREERKKKRITKAIRRLEKNARQFKPLDEMEIPLPLIQEKEIRARANPTISEEEEIYRDNLLKRWSVYKQQQSVAETYMLGNLRTSIDKALEELYNESEDLWLEAIQFDQSFLPFRAKGPVRTPAIKDFDSPDGEYIIKTKTYK